MENTGKKWTQEEINFLKENYASRGVKYCSEVLKREIKAVRKFANRNEIKGKFTREKYLEENLRPIIEDSKSIGEALIKMGLRRAGGNHKVIKKYIERYNIDTSHFMTQAERVKANPKFHVKRPIEYYLVENNYTSSSDNVKKRLYREGILKPICSGCGLGEIWMGKKISMILDHKNGINSDYRLENLRVFCPNCNATLDTHCRGAKYLEEKKIKDELKKQNKEIKKIENNKIFYDRRKVKDRPPLEQLLLEVNELGYVKTGKKYGVSDNAVRKWIINYQKEK